MLKRWNTLTLCTLTALGLAGCRIQSAIDANGAATVDVKYRVSKNVTLEAEKKRFESDAVKVVSASVDENNYASVQVKTDDVTKLPTAKFFREATITRVDGENGTKVLTAKIVHEKPQKLPDQSLEYVGKDLEVSVTLPGEIVASNATKTEKSTATWSYGLNEFLGAKEVSMTVTYKQPDKEAGGTPASPQGGTPSPKDGPA